MKSIKKFMASAVLGTYLLTGGIFANFHTLDASASFGSDPAIYSNIVDLGSGLYRADIMCENMPNIISGAFNIEIGTGWSFVLDGTDIDYENPLHFVVATGTPTSSSVFVALARASEVNPNRTIFSVYLNKTNSYSSNNATVNVEFGANDGLYTLSGGDYNPDSFIYPLLAPEMTASYEYRIGDVNNDGILTSVDASLISVAISNNNNNRIDINGANTYFPNAVALEVADVDRDEYITNDDAQYVLSYYVYVSSNMTPVGTYYTGEWDIYEEYDV